MGENFSFFPPVMFAAFGILFLLFIGWRRQEAACWSAGFLCLSIGCALGFLFAAFPWRIWNVMADLLFTAGLFLFGEAMLKRWRAGWIRPARLSLGAATVLICAAASALNDVHLELFAVDTGCFLLIALPLVSAHFPSLSRPDKALFCAAFCFGIYNLGLAATIHWTLPEGQNYFTSQYAYVEQALSSVMSLFLALAALAAMVLDLLHGYRHAAHVDPLSGLLNRRGFDEATRGMTTAGGSLLLCDIDHFKAVNDRYGHVFGDRVIVLLAAMLRDLAPGNAVSARFGGEEFVLYLPGLHVEEAQAIADMARLRFAETTGPRLHVSYRFTASFGLSSVRHSDASLLDCIARADAALYEAKAMGRNCIRVHDGAAFHSPRDSVIWPMPMKKAARNGAALSCSS